RRSVLASCGGNVTHERRIPSVARAVSSSGPGGIFVTSEFEQHVNVRPAHIPRGVGACRLGEFPDGLVVSPCVPVRHAVAGWGTTRLGETGAAGRSQG